MSPMRNAIIATTRITTRNFNLLETAQWTKMIS